MSRFSGMDDPFAKAEQERINRAGVKAFYDGQRLRRKLREAAEQAVERKPKADDDAGE